LYYFVGSVDDEISHEGPAFNRDLVKAGYTIDVISADGYTVTFDAQRVQYNKNIMVAYKVNDNALPEEFFPLRLVGDDLEKKEMVGMIEQIKVGLEPLPEAAASAPTEEASAAESTATGSFVIKGLVNQEMGFMEADLRALEVLKINAEHPKNGPQDFEGVSLNTLLDLAGVKDSAQTLFVTSADGYTTELALSDVRACTDCLLGFTDTAEQFKLVMPKLPSNTWAKEVISIEVK
jgi:DMSO/TMAO reductase YedYZ molybdopterin-dependent catalytic subunit